MAHTAPEECGKVLALVKPRHAVVYHFFNDFDTAPEIEREIRKHYQGPLALAQDLMVFNVTKDEIATRLAVTPTLVWPNKERHDAFRAARAQEAPDRCRAGSPTSSCFRSSRRRKPDRMQPDVSAGKSWQAPPQRRSLATRANAAALSGTPDPRGQSLYGRRRGRDHHAAVRRQMEQRLGQKLVFEAKPGAAGNIGTQEVARAAPDGYTLLVAATNNFVINQFVIKMPFDPMAALAPIAKVADVPLVLFSNPAVPARTLQRVHRLRASANPGKANYGMPGLGTVNHLMMERLKQATGVDIARVPYRGSPQATLALLQNDIQLFPIGLAAVGGTSERGQADGACGRDRAAHPACCPTCRPWPSPDFRASSPPTGGAWRRRPARRTTILDMLAQAVAEAQKTAVVKERFTVTGHAGARTVAPAVRRKRQGRGRAVAGNRRSAGRSRWNDAWQAPGASRAGQSGRPACALPGTRSAAISPACPGRHIHRSWPPERAEGAVTALAVGGPKPRFEPCRGAPDQ